MPRLVHRHPKYQKRRASGQAIVTIDGQEIYFGPHGTKASRDEYDRVIGERFANGREGDRRAIGRTSPCRRSCSTSCGTRALPSMPRSESTKAISITTARGQLFHGKHLINTQTRGYFARCAPQHVDLADTPDEHPASQAFSRGCTA